MRKRPEPQRCAKDLSHKDAQKAQMLHLCDYAFEAKRFHHMTVPIAVERVLLSTSKS
jgi:hypothetical protein